MEDTSLHRHHNQEQHNPSADISTLRQSPANIAAGEPTSWDTIRQPVEPGTGLTVRSAVKELLETAIYILLVFVIVRSMVQNFKIEGSSMEPTLQGGQYILVNKLVYFHFDLNAPLRLLPGYADEPARLVYPLGLPERGDVIVFEYPNNIEKDYIKRVIGIPGDKIRIRNGQVYLNGNELPEPYLIDEKTMPENPTYCNPGNTCHRETVTVPEGTVFVLGDNRRNSSDSREWDSLELKHIIGKAWILYYPLDDLHVITHPAVASDRSK